MSNALVPSFRTRVRRFLNAGSRKGKVEQLENLTRSLSSNTQLVAKKYGELKVVEEEVKITLNKLKTETFEKENQEIDSLAALEKEEKEKFKKALVNIKNRGVSELEPIAETSQRIKAHMLVTLNKAMVQKAILIAKSKLAGNAHLQLETLKTIEKETKNINFELKELLTELDTLNESAIDKFSEFRKDVKDTIEKDESQRVIKHIFNKLGEIKPGVRTGEAS